MLLQCRSRREAQLVYSHPARALRSHHQGTQEDHRGSTGRKSPLKFNQKKIIYTLQLQSKRNKAADGSKGSKGLCCRCWFQQAQWQEGSLSTFRLGKEGPETCESTAALLIRNKCLFSIWMRYLKSPHFEDTQGKETPTWFSEQLSFILSDVVAAAAIARSVQEPHLIMQKMQKTFRTTDGAVCNIWSQINTFSSTKAMSLAPEHCH